MKRLKSQLAKLRALRTLRTYIQVLGGKMMSAFYRLLSVINAKYLVDKRRPQTIVFESFKGASFACSPKALYQAILQHPRFSDTHRVWAFKHPEQYTFLNEHDPDLELVKSGSAAHKRALRTANIVITNSAIRNNIRKRSGQIWVQTWHGTPFKKLRADLDDTAVNNFNQKRDYQRLNRVDTKRYDLILAQSRYAADKLASSFEITRYGKPEALQITGLPRNDALVNATDQDIAELKAKHNIPQDTTVILYAPTWRDNSRQANLKYAENTQVDLAQLTNELKQQLGENMLLLVRSHYYVENDVVADSTNNAVYRNVSDVDDVNELYLIANALVTDYSSVFFDYALLHRPIYFLMKDLVEYRDNIRGLYFGLEELPGPVYETEEELAAAIQHDLGGQNMEQQNSRLAATTESIIFDGLADDGQATMRVLDRIIQKISEK